MSSGHQDRMSSVPLMNLHERRNYSNTSPNVEQEWSDQEIEEFSRDPLESVLMQMRLWPQAITRQQCVQSSCFFSAIALCVGFLFAYVMFLFFCPPTHNCNFMNNQDKHVEDKLQQLINSDSIKMYLSNLTKKSQASGQNVLSDYVVQQWRDSGLDDLKIHNYSVLLSYPNEQKPNKVQVMLNGMMETVATFSSSGNTNHSTIDFSPYSAVGDIKGELVYANYGEAEDLQTLSSTPEIVSLKKKILLVRYGATQPSTIIKNAIAEGASGILFYPDPRDEMIHSHFIGSTAFILGDPLTPHFPSKDYAYRLKESSGNLPNIHVQPITAVAAEKLFKLMNGKKAPQDWQGSLNVTYLLYSLTTDDKMLYLTINNQNNQTILHNVIGVVKGKLEPDRYILVGSHRNVKGANSVDTLSGTAALLELVRVFGTLKKKNWRPRRTIVFCSWADDDAISSTEWTEEFAKLLSERAVAYLNMDIIVQGFDTMHAVAVPSLNQLLFDTARKIANPNSMEVKAGRKTVFDTWLHKSSNFSVPQVYLPAARSDYASFIHMLGIPVVDVCYMCAENSTTHTSKQLDALHISSDIKYQETVVRIVAEITRSLADSLFLPFNVTQYAKFINNSFNDLSHHNSNAFKSKGIKLNFFEMAVRNFTAAADNFERNLARFDGTNPFNLRAINDEMMQLERSFLEPLGLSCSSFKHSLYATESSLVNNVVFPCLHYALKYLDDDNIQQELSAMIFYIESATTVLQSNPL